MDINKLKVADLRKELQARGLDTKGNKPVLVERLKEAIAKEEEEPEEEEDEESENEESSGGENSLTYETAESANTTVREATSAASEERAFSVITSAASKPQNNVADDTDSESFSAPAANEITASDYSLAKSQTEDSNASESEKSQDSLSQNQAAQQEQETMPEQDDTSQQEDSRDEFNDKTETVEENQFVKESSPEVQDEPELPQVSEKVAEQSEVEDSCKDPSDATQILDNSGVQNVSNDTLPYESSIEASLDTAGISNSTKETQDFDESMDQDKSSLNDISQSSTGNDETLPRTDDAEKMDTDTTQEDSEAKKSENSQDDSLWNSDDESSAKPKESAPEAPPAEDVPAEEPKRRVRKSRFDQPEERKRKHSPSPSGDGYQSGAHYEGPAKIPKQDDEPSYDQDSVLLSWYDSDLNLVINKENFVGAVPLAEQGFMYMWGGARSTYGFNSGKVYYEVKLLEKCPVNMYDDFEIYSFRLGWSVAYSSLQLGETSLSYGYDSSGKKCTNDTFEEYGQPFNAEDVIGCLLDFDSNEENVLISYAFNGTKQEVAFEVPKSSLEDKALFPHILSKNISFEVNFGDRLEAWNTDESFKEDFEWAAKVPLEQRIQGPKKPEEKTECEVIMMCGLPCSGKTTWVKNHVESHPQKMYNVIGIDFAFSKMKVLSEPIQTYFKDTADVLVEKCTRCVNHLTDLASVRWRNYIFDQPNVIAPIQRRKMRNFEGYTRIAIVIIPNEEEYERMLEKWNDNAFRETSISLLELKGGFKLPEEGELFNNVSFVGLNKEEAEEVVKKYNKEGRDSRPRDDRPYNRGFGGRDHMDRMQPYGRPPMGGYRQRWGMDNRGPPSSMGRGGWAPRGGMDRMPPGGYRDRRNWRDRSPDDDRDGYRGGRGRYEPRGMPGNRYGNSGPMMGGNRWGGGGGGRDRDRMAPGMGGRPGGGGPNPLMGQMMGKPGMGYDRKGGGRYGSDDGKRRDDTSAEDYDRTRGIPPPGVEPDNNDDSFDDGAGSGGEDGDRKRRSRFSDSADRRGGRGGGGYQGRGGSGGRGGSNGRPGPFPPGKGPRGGGGYNRGGREGNSDYYGGRGGGPPRRDNRDNRNQMGPGPRQGSSRFDKRDNGGKNDGNSQVSQSGWGMYGQGGWNQAAAANYQNWAQYQGYTAQQAQQMQQYWSQMQQQQNQAGGQNQQSQQSSGGPQQNAKNSNSGSSSNTPATAASASQSASNSSTQQSSGASGGYNTQGYNTAGYGTQGYDANAYAQYCAQYYSQLAQQGWTQQVRRK